MAVLLQKILWTPTGSTTEEELTDVIKITITQSADLAGSSADITLINSTNQTINSNLHHKYIDDLGQNKFNEGDIFKIYLVYAERVTTIDTSDNSEHLIMTTELAEYQVNATENKTQIVLKTVDKTYALLNKLWTFNYDTGKSPEPSLGPHWTAPLIIQDVIRKVTNNAISGYDKDGRRNAGSFEVDARLQTGPYPGLEGSPPAFIQNKRVTAGTETDGTFENLDRTNFPRTNLAKIFKPAYEFIKDLSTLEATNTPNEINSGDPPVDRNYIFYIDHENRFHWFYPEDSARSTLSSNITAISSTIPLASVVGFTEKGIVQIGSEIIKYTGRDTSTDELTGLTRAHNNTVAASHSSGDRVGNTLRLVQGDISTGFHIYNFKLTKKTFDIVNMVIFNAGADLNGSGILGYRYDVNTKSKEFKMVYKPLTHLAKDLIKAELPASLNGNGNLTQDNTTPGPFTYEGNRYDNASAYNFATSWGTTVTSDSTYNTAVRDEADIKGGQFAEKMFARHGSPRWKGSIEFRGKRVQAGELINFTSYSAGIVNQDLRMTKVTHQIGKAGWFTTIDVEEDERKQGE